MFFTDIPEPASYTPCYMVTPAMEIIDLSHLCGDHPKTVTIQAETRAEFVERMAEIVHENDCADPIIGKQKGYDFVAREVRANNYPVDIYVEIGQRVAEKGLCL